MWENRAEMLMLAATTASGRPRRWVQAEFNSVTAAIGDAETDLSNVTARLHELRLQKQALLKEFHATEEQQEEVPVHAASLSWIRSGAQADGDEKED